MHRLRELLRFWFTFDPPVSRGEYFRHGAGLMVVKYAVDASLIWAIARTTWTPWDYLTTGAAFAHSTLAGAPPPLLSFLAIWTLPFLWIGLSMSVRRALDAGWSAWWALLFFVPVVNYAVMVLFSCLPSAPRLGPERLPTRNQGRLPSAALAIAIGVGIDLGMMTISVYGLREYGISLFLGTPFVVGAVSAYIFNRRYAATEGETIQLALITLAVIAGVMVTFAFEGAMCLLMASPLAAGIGFLGAITGRAIALRDPRSPSRALLALVILPAGQLLGPDAAVGAREVRSAIEIDAPPDSVWSRVVSFPPLPEPSSLVRHMGIAYPRRARIEGSGVGAVRYCEFSTGAFVEPIRVWDPAHRLSFDVIREPSPMREWSFYPNLAPPHLDGFFRARRGEFRLVRLTGNRTRLEGSTWYELRIHPVVYWSVFADLIVSRIHYRVLQHIKAVAEKKG